MTKTIWTLSVLKKEALKYKTRGEFQKYNKKAYASAHAKKLLDTICSHMKPVRTYWSFDMLKEEALKYKSRTEFQRKNPSAYQIAYGRKILDIICSHTKSSWVINGWTFEELQEEAMKYDTRKKFKIGNRSAYNAARKIKILEKICEHMVWDCHRPYSLEELKQEALKYDTKGQFSKNNGGAYKCASSREDFDEICKHMKKSKNSSFSEMELFNTIKTAYPEIKKLRDRKVCIKAHSYIKGFDIDIFDIYSNKGIEFDGTYHHSFDYMRKSRAKRKWTDEDIKNYHQLKDGWFATKGIQILHIKEEDWIENKQTCIDRCFRFLASHNG